MHEISKYIAEEETDIMKNYLKDTSIFKSPVIFLILQTT